MVLLFEFFFYPEFIFLLCYQEQRFMFDGGLPTSSYSSSSDSSSSSSSDSLPLLDRPPIAFRWGGKEIKLDSRLITKVENR